jgi:hypothetical protein
MRPTISAALAKNRQVLVYTPTELRPFSRSLTCLLPLPWLLGHSLLMGN